MSLDIGYTFKIFTHTVTSNYINFSGRVSRFDYWHYFLFAFILGIVLSFALALIGSIGVLISNLISLALLLPGLGLTVRRLHDIGKPWFWILIVLIPIVGALVLIYFLAQAGTGDNEFGAVPPTRSAG